MSIFDSLVQKPPFGGQNKQRQFENSLKVKNKKTFHTQISLFDPLNVLKNSSYQLISNKKQPT